MRESENSSAFDGTVQDRVAFNVGGQVFITTLTTVSKYGVHYLSEIANRKKTWADTGEPIFIDRNPKMFEYVLDFLRKGSVNFKPKCYWLRNLLDEAEYYDIVPLINIVKTEFEIIKMKELEAEIAFRSSESPHLSATISSSHYRDPTVSRKTSPIRLTKFPSDENCSISKNNAPTTLVPLRCGQHQPAPPPSNDEVERSIGRRSLINDAPSPPDSPRESYDLGEQRFCLNEDF